MSVPKLNRREFIGLGGMLATQLLAGCASDDVLEPFTGAFRIGGMGPYTGSSVALGTPVKLGTWIAIEEVSEEGRVPVELDWVDDENNVKKAPQRYIGLKDWGLKILAGPATADCFEAIVDETTSDRVFVLTPTVSDMSVLERPSADGEALRRDNVFQLCLSDAGMGRAVASCIADKGLSRRVGVVYNDRDEYASSIHQAFSQQAAELQIEVIDATFQDGGGLDADEALQKLQEAGIDFIFLAARATAAQAVLRRARAMEYAPQFLCVDDERGIGSALAAATADVSLVEGLLMVTTFVAASEREDVKAFNEAFETKAILDKYPQTTPTQGAAAGYDCVYAIARAIEQAGVTPDQSPQEVCEALISVFADGGFSCGGLTCPEGETMSWSATGEVDKPVQLAVVHEGRLVPQG